MIGSLFIRSYERSERVYQAMLARGFQGQIKSARPQRLAMADLQIGLALFLALAALIVSGRLPWWSN